MEEKRGVGLPGKGIHLVDHIGVVCIGMDIPLLFTDEQDYLIARRYYPELNALLVDDRDVAPDRLTENYDILFSPNYCDRTLFKDLFGPAEERHGKQMRWVYCSHGNSDKGQAYYLMEMYAEEDIVLLYGQRMMDFLKEKDVFHQLQHFVVTGNYRFPYYRKHRAFYDAIVEEEIFSRLPKKKKAILYAPTWNREDTSFFSACASLCDNLPDDYNLIVKVHPEMESENYGAVYRMLSRYEDRANILFLRNFPPIYPLLARIDIYVGDMSSIGYDFLAFNKPMFFLNEYARGPNRRNDFFLFRCGVDVAPSNYDSLYSLIEESCLSDQERFSKIRQETYLHTFGEERPFADIRAELWKICEDK
jgi:hypothetical protein